MNKPFTFVVVLATAVLFMTGAPSHGTKLPKRRTQTEQTQPTHEITQAADKIAFAVSNAVQPAKDDRGCNEGEDDRKSDLCAQWKAADAAKAAADWSARAFWVGLVGTALLIWSLLTTIKGTRAAVDALESQIAAERPIMNLSSIAVAKHDQQQDESLVLRVMWSLQNLGATGCWIEGICVWVDDSLEDQPSWKEAEVNAFVAPGKALTNQPDGATVAFDAEETVKVQQERKVVIIGYTRYRGISGRRWKTGFAAAVPLDENLAGTGFQPLPSDKHWIDEKLPNAR